MFDNSLFFFLAVLGSFVIGAALTPTPDMVNQTLLAVPLIVLYELSIWLIRIFEYKAKNKSRDEGTKQSVKKSKHLPQSAQRTQSEEQRKRGIFTTDCTDDDDGDAQAAGE